MKGPVIASLVLLVAGCASQKTLPEKVIPQEALTATPAPPKNRITYAGGDGSSCEASVKIIGAKGENDGVDAEYLWIRQRFPGANVLSQTISDCRGHKTDTLTIGTTPDGTKKVYFDISDFYGKF